MKDETQSSSSATMHIYINAQVMHVEAEKMWAPCRKVKNTFLKKIHEYVESEQLSF